MGTTASAPKRGKSKPAAEVNKSEAPAKQPAVPAPAPQGKVQYVKVPPNAAKTLTAIREMGYDSFASILDLVDNSIDARASKIAVQIKEQGKGVIIIDVLDNGKGMDEPTLAQALRLGSDTEHTERDLGKYGFGLVSASLSMAKSIYVLSRKNKGQAFEAVLDLDTISRENDFVITLAPATGAKVFETLGDQGTLVRLSQIDRINDTNVARFAANLRARMAQVYREFIKAGLALSVNGRLVKAEDPLMRGHPQTDKRVEQEIKFGEGQSAWLTIVELPDLGQLGNEQAGILPHRSGFYVVRNGRQIMEAQTFGLYRHHHSYSGFRAELSFTGELDHLFHVDIKKSIIHPDDKLIEKLADVARKYIEDSGRRSRTRGDGDAPKLKLDAVTDVLNAALQATDVPAAATTATGPTPHIVDGHGTKFIDEAMGQPATAANGGAIPVEGKDVQAPKKGKRGEAQPEVAPAPVEHKPPRVRFQDYEAEPTELCNWTEKDGQWLIRLNTKHPLVRVVADAKHKQANAVLSYITFALAQAWKDEPQKTAAVVKLLGENLAAILAGTVK
jgi:hypothetical protein